MKKENKVTFEVTQKIELTEEDLESILCIASDGTIGFDYWSHYDDLTATTQNNYKKARAQLVSEGIDSDKICLEQVWARMLFNGHGLYLLEAECDGDDDSSWHYLTLEKVIEGLKLYFEKGYNTNCKTIQSLLNDGDLYDSDAVIQYAIYGEVIYG